MVHCKTEEEAKDFCKQMHEHGMKWCNGESYLKIQIIMRETKERVITEPENIRLVFLQKSTIIKSWNGVIICRKNLQSQI